MSPDRHKRDVTASRANPNRAIGIAYPDSLLATVNLRLLCRIQRRPFFAAHWIDQDDARDFFGVQESKLPHHQPAKRVSHQYVRRLDAGFTQQFVQFHSDIARRARGPARAAPAQTTSIVRGGAGEPRNLLLDVEPVEIGGCNPRFKQNGGFARSLFRAGRAAVRCRSRPTCPQS